MISRGRPGGTHSAKRPAAAPRHLDARRYGYVLAAGALCLLLAGCAYTWRKPGADPAQVRRDEARCAAYARAHASSARYQFPPREVRRKINGTVVTEYEYPPESLIQSRLYAECMEDRGYEAVWEKE